MSKNTTIAGLRDQVWDEYGVHLEQGKSLVMEGGEGARKIADLVESYSTNPPTEIDGSASTAIRDYAKGGFYDQEGDEIPESSMLFVDLADGRRFAVRPSGTEPKIKYYLFGKGEDRDGVQKSLDELWEALERDAYERMK